MGTQCSKDNDNSPDLSDVCSNEAWDMKQPIDINNTNYVHKMPNYCGDTYICTSLGAGPRSNGGDNGISVATKAPEDCCDGQRVYCVRVRFPGDPEICCEQSYNQNKILQNCFSGPGNTNACDPKYRDITGTACEDVFVSNCLNAPNTDAEFYAAWTKTSFCSKSILVRAQSNPNWSNAQMNAVFQKYFSQNPIRSGATAGQFQNYLYNLCLNNPSVCQTALINTCINYTNEEAKGNPDVANLCGCHMNSVQNSLYTNVYGINVACTALCARPTTVQTTDATGQVVQCPGSVCIIDDVTISLANSSSGNINFGQVCGGCNGNTACKCLISGVSVDVADSKLGNINLQQNCTGVPITPGTNPSPSPNPTPAPDPGTDAGTGTGTLPSAITDNMQYIIAAVVFFLVFLLMCLLLSYFVKT